MNFYVPPPLHTLTMESVPALSFSLHLYFRIFFPDNKDDILFKFERNVMSIILR